MSAEKLVEYFCELEDVHCTEKVMHQLIDVLVIAVCAVIVIEAKRMRRSLLNSLCAVAAKSPPVNDEYLTHFLTGLFHA